MTNAPLCKCGCGNPVAESKKKPGTWNRYFSRHGKKRNPEQFKTPPKCKCGCGRSVTWQMFGQRWRAYAKGCVPLITEVNGAFYTKESLAKILGVSERTIERRVKRKKLPKPVLVIVPGFNAYFTVFRTKDFYTKEMMRLLKRVRATARLTNPSARSRQGK